MARPRLILATALALLGLSAVAPAARAELSVESMLSPTTVTAIDLQLPPASVSALEAEPEEYVEGTFSIAETGGAPATIGPFSDPLTVGVRLKGNLGSFRDLSGKAAFKVKFNEFVDGQKFLGLKGLTLNNMVQDPSMLHEALVYDAFRAAGLAAPRSGYAYVHLNGIDYGLHANVETMDDVALEERFGELEDSQHLYEGVPLKDLTPGNAGEFEVDEGDEEDVSDLEALIAAANAQEPSFSARLAPVADLDQMTRYWAAERYLGHWDGYSSSSLNNYYLFSDASGRFQMIPWGTDQTLDFWWYPFTGDGGTLFAQCVAEPGCFDAYVQDLIAVEASTTALDLPSRADQLAALLAPWQAQEIAQSTRAPFSAAQIAAGVAGVHEFLAKRPGALARWLDVPLPDPQPPTDTERSDSTADPDPPPPGPFNRVTVDRAKLGQGIVVARLKVNAPGRITLTGAIGPPDKRRRACSTRPRAVPASTATLACRLSDPIRERLRLGPLTLRLTITFDPSGVAPPLSLERLAQLPRESG